MTESTVNLTVLALTNPTIDNGSELVHGFFICNHFESFTWLIKSTVDWLTSST
jgi:hypothetical protein